MMMMRMMGPSPKLRPLLRLGAFRWRLLLLLTLARRCGSSVPPSLIEEASWATPAFAPFARQALALTVRRSLASRLRDGGVSPVEAQARLAEPPRDSPQDPLRVFDAPEPDPAD